MKMRAPLRLAAEFQGLLTEVFYRGSFSSTFTETGDLRHNALERYSNGSAQDIGICSPVLPSRPAVAHFARLMETLEQHQVRLVSVM
jgi:hypothetical protein